jgi:hypothetical protein
VLTLNEESYLIISPDFVTNREQPNDGVLGEYGLGYAFMKNPINEGQLAYGPGYFDVAFQLINFEVLDGGEIRSHLVFVANRPSRVVDVVINPLGWGLALADLLSLGVFSRVVFPSGPPRSLGPSWRTGFDPVLTGINVANWLTGGLARRALCISRDELDRRLLIQHFMQHYQMLTGTVLTWRQIPDWCDESKLPEWVITGAGA